MHEDGIAEIHYFLHYLKFLVKDKNVAPLKYTVKTAHRSHQLFCQDSNIRHSCKDGPHLALYNPIIVHEPGRRILGDDSCSSPHAYTDQGRSAHAPHSGPWPLETNPAVSRDAHCWHRSLSLPESRQYMDSLTD